MDAESVISQTEAPRGRVLVVEDDDAMRELLSASLARAGFAVASTASAREALDAFADTPADVVICDINLGGMSGLELCAKFVEERADVPVVVITAYGSMDVAIDAIRSGAWDFVTKPFEMTSLVISLDRALKHRRMSREVASLRE